MTGGKFTRRVIEARRSASRVDDEASGGGAALDAAPLGGTKAEAAQRLQIGLFGLGAMVLLVGLAGVLGNQANLTEESAVPEAAPTTEPSAATPQRDPLADAGIVPEIPAEEPVPAPEEGQVEDLPLSAGAAAEDNEAPANETPES